MNDMNNVLLEGNSVRDVEVKASNSSGHKFAVFTIASNRYYYDDKEEKQKDTLYMSVIAGGKLLEPCEEKIKKGYPLRVVGRLKEASWQNDKGEKRSRVEIIAEHIDFLGRSANGIKTETFSVGLSPEEVFEVEKTYSI